MKQFVKMPTQWIRDQKNPLLRKFKWNDDNRAGNIAALMIYIVLVQHMNVVTDRNFEKPGFVKMPYAEFIDITGLSRAKISAGIEILEKHNLIVVDRTEKTNVYKIVNCEAQIGWGQLPYKHLYQGGQTIKAFHEFSLRKRAELDALKLYFLLIAFRDNKSNHATISYEKINDYTGIPVNRVRTAISFLISHVMIQVDQKKSDDLDTMKTTNYYRIVGIPGQHFGNMNTDGLGDDD